MQRVSLRSQVVKANTGVIVNPDGKVTKPHAKINFTNIMTYVVGTFGTINIVAVSETRLCKEELNHIDKKIHSSLFYILSVSFFLINKS